KSTSHPIEPPSSACAKLRAFAHRFGLAARADCLWWASQGARAYAARAGPRGRALDRSHSNAALAGSGRPRARGHPPPARAPRRGEAEVPDRACLDARVLSGSVELHTLYPDAHHATMVAWGHGSALIGECGQARSYPVDSAAEPLAIAVAPGERIDSAIAP